MHRQIKYRKIQGSERTQSLEASQSGGPQLSAQTARSQTMRSTYAALQKASRQCTDPDKLKPRDKGTRSLTFLCDSVYTSNEDLICNSGPLEEYHLGEQV